MVKQSRWSVLEEVKAASSHVTAASASISRKDDVEGVASTHRRLSFRRDSKIRG